MFNMNHAFDGDIAFGARASGTYLCMPCDVQFQYQPGATDCPVCKTEERDELAALYVECDADSIEAEYLHPFGFSAG